MAKVSPIAAIRALQMTDQQIETTRDLDIIRAIDHAVNYNVMWSPPFFTTPDHKPKDGFMAIMKRDAVDGVVSLIHTKALGNLEPPGKSHARLVAYVHPSKAKPLARLGCTCVSSPYAGLCKGTTIRNYPLAVGYLEYWEGFQYIHTDDNPYHIDAAYQYNQDIADVDAGIAYLERNMRRLGRI